MYLPRRMDSSDPAAAVRAAMPRSARRLLGVGVEEEEEEEEVVGESCGACGR
jgi:hypothetical protein